MEKINTHPALTFKIIFVLCFMVMQIGAFAGQCDTVNIIANAGEDVDISNGADTTLTATGGTSYLWSTGETTPSITVSPTETSSYIVTVADENGCSDTDTVVVSVGCRPLISVKGGDVCKGDTIAVDLITTQLFETCEVLCYNGKLMFDHTKLEYVDYDLTGTLSENSMSVARMDGIDSIKFQSLFTSSKRYVGMGSLIKFKFIALEESVDSLELFTFHFNNIEQFNITNGSVTVHPLPTVTLDDLDPVSLNGGTIELTGGAPEGGIYSGPGIAASPDFDPQAAGPGTHDIVYTYTNGNGCANSDTTQITVNCDPTITANGGEVCQGDTITVSISTSEILESCKLDNYQMKLIYDSELIEFIEYDLEGTLNEEATIYYNNEDSLITWAALSGPNNIQLIGAGNLINFKFKGLSSGVSSLELDPGFARMNANPLSRLISGEVTVHLSPTVTLDDLDPVSLNGGTIELTGGAPEGGIYSGPGIAASPDFDPQAAGPGTHDIVYTYTNGNGCANSDTTQITVNCDPTITANGGEVCQGDTITVSISTSTILESCGLDNYQLALRFDSAVLDYIGYDRTGTLNETARIYDFDVDTMVGIVALPGLNDVQLIGAGDLIKLNFLAVNPGNSYLNFITDYFRFNGILDTNLMNGSVTVHAPPAANPSYQVSASDPVYYNFEANASSNATGFNWDFGDSTFSSEANPVHMFGSGGANLVILTITSDKGCTSNDTLTNQFTAPDYFYIRGNVDAGGARVNNGKAIAYTIIDGNYYAVDTTDIVDGQYEFYSVPGGQYIVYAIPERSETGYVPTYYGDKTLWEDAFVLNLNSGEGVENVDISLAETANASGNSQITGTFLWEKMQSDYAGGIFSDPVTKSETSDVAEGLVVVLYDDTYEPVQWVATDTNGHYAFDGLESGTYYLKAEAPGYTMDYIELTVNQQLTFNMAVQDDGIVAGIGTMTVRQQESAMVYPNPVYASSFLTVSGIPAENLHVKIYTSTGILQKHESFKGKTDIILKQSDFSPGFYFYKIYNTKECIVKGSFIVK